MPVHILTSSPTVLVNANKPSTPSLCVVENPIAASYKRQETYESKQEASVGQVRNDEEISEKRSSELHMLSNYNEFSAAQASAAYPIASLLRRAAAKVDATLPEGESLKICEYGCATGGSSRVPLRAIQDTVTTDRHLVVIMNDLPYNDWNVLKRTIEPEFPSIDFQYKRRSMYGPVGTVNLAYSAYAQHWLQKGAPSGLPDGAMWSNQLPRDNKYRKIWEDASRKDWEDLLSIRSVEVAPGGIMVFHIQSSMCCGGLNERFAGTLQQAKLAMIASGELTSKEAMAMVCPEYLKSPAEILAPLVSGPLMSLWEVEEVVYQKLPCPYVEKFEKSPHSTGKEVVEEQIRFLRSFMDSSLYAAVGEEKTDSFWVHAQKIAGNDPHKLSSVWPGTFLYLRRTSVEAELPSILKVSD